MEAKRKAMETLAVSTKETVTKPVASAESRLDLPTFVFPARTRWANESRAARLGRDSFHIRREKRVL
jgi:hypothetical protein